MPHHASPSTGARRHTHSAAVLAALVPLVALAPEARAQCPGWSSDFGTAGVTTIGPGNGILEADAVATFDDGSGPALYVGGTFMNASGAPTPRIARWNGTSWSAVGSGITQPGGAVRALRVFDDGLGGGPALYVGGQFGQAGGVAASCIARWNGSAWSALGSGLGGGVLVLEVLDDGTGPALYAGGDFTTAGGTAAARVARWNGTSWSPLGAGLAYSVTALTVHDDGTGPRPYAASGFGIHRWDGSTWTGIGAGLPFPPVWPNPPPSTHVFALASFDDGTGPELYAGGKFDYVSSSPPATNVARWNGTSWSPVPGSPVASLSQIVFALRVLDDGTGPRLHMAGALGSVHRYDGATWTALGTAAWPPVRALAGFDAATPGPGSLYVAGAFVYLADGAEANRVAGWNGSAWVPVGGGQGLDDAVFALARVDEGAESVLYAGGAFTRAGSVPANRVARWNGSAWSALGSGCASGVLALAGHEESPGNGQLLFAGGDFLAAGGGAASRVARWNGTAWSALGSGVDDEVQALASFDDGTGPALYAGGRLLNAGGVPAARIARWNGTSWSGVGGGIIGTFVSAFAVHDDGTGPALYAGGWFSSAGGVPASNLARWNGTAWSAVSGGVNGQVITLLAFDDGGGPALFAGGWFTNAGGAPAPYVARWRNGTWAGLAGGLTSAVYALAAHDDGSGGGPGLYATGTFSLNGGSVADRAARWNGTAWTALGTGLGYNGGRALASFHDGSAAGPALYFGGEFGSAGDQQSGYLAAWKSCGNAAAEYCFGDGALGVACPCGNASPVGQHAGCRNSIGQAARLVATGTASIAADGVVLATTGTPATTTVLYVQGTGVEHSGLGAPLGDGLLCVGGALIRLGTKSSSAGASQFPAPGDPPVSVRGGVPAGATRTYQAYYRNAASFCTPSTANLSNGVRILWLP